MNPIRRRRLGGQAFNPLSIPGMKFWYRADSLGLADGAGIGTWLDSSGNGNTLTQGTGANQPIYKVNIQNGMPVARFNGTTQLMTSATFGTTLAQPDTIILVASNASTAAVHMIIDGLLARNAINYQVGGAINIYAGTNVSGGSAVTGMNIITTIFNGASSENYVNGALNFTGNANTIGMDGVTLGAAFNASVKLAGDIAEALAYSGALGAGARASLHRYLGSKYGLAVSG